MNLSVSLARRLALPVACAAAVPVFAQTQLQEVVVTASRIATPITDVLADVTVIDRTILDQAGQTSLRDILAQQPGVQLVTNGGYRSVSGILLRGASSAQTLLLVDGIRVGSSTAGGAAFESIPLQSIERIEILRGAASALYGPDAVGGVIQIFTREPTQALALSASLGFGTDGQQQGGASVRGTNGAVGYSLGVWGEKGAGISAITNPVNGSFNPDKDGFSSASVDAKLTAKIDPNHLLSLSLLYSDNEYQFDGTPFPNPLRLTRLTSDAVAKPKITALTFKWDAQFRDNWKSTLTAGAVSDDAVSHYYRVPDGLPAGRDKFNTDRRQLTWQNDFALDKDVFSFMLESRSEEVDSSTLYNVTRRSLGSGLLSYAFNRADWNALAVLRTDYNSQFGSFTNWALSGGYRLTGALRAVASVGTSFQAPTFNQLYFPGFGNPALQPQQNRNSEVGLKYYAGGVSLNAFVYHNEIEGFITPATNVQVSRAVLRGVSVNGDAQFGATNLSLSYDYTDPRTHSNIPALDNQRLVRVAQNVVNARVTHTQGDLTAFGELRLSSERQDSKVNFAPGRDTLAGYGLLNLGLSWNFRKDWVLLARLNNATDQNYSLANGYSAPGRNLFVSLSWTL